MQKRPKSVPRDAARGLGKGLGREPWWSWVVFLAPVVICGCGYGPEGPTGSVTGKVTYQGSPVSEGAVSFFCAESNTMAGGTLGPDGSYTLLFAGGPQVPVGTYKVTVNPPARSHEPGQAPPPLKEYPNIPAKYRDRATSDLEAQITEDTLVFNFDLTE